jgi:endogenous inhibitor of DNA gyrase (YacG/DUF329 family)
MPAADDPPPPQPPPPPGRRPSARGRCPICARPPDARHRPFCSARCAQIDLGRWLTGGYAIASEEEPDPGRAEEEAARRGDR